MKSPNYATFNVLSILALALVATGVNGYISSPAGNMSSTNNTNAMRDYAHRDADSADWSTTGLNRDDSSLRARDAYEYHSNSPHSGDLRNRDARGLRNRDSNYYNTDNTDSVWSTRDSLYNTLDSRDRSSAASRDAYNNSRTGNNSRYNGYNRNTDSASMDARRNTADSARATGDMSSTRPMGSR